MRNVVVDAELQHLGVDHDHFALVGGVRRAGDLAVKADRLRTGGLQRLGIGQVSDDRIAGDILAEDQQQRHILILECVAADQL
jgi:hypothetical protein